jgi:1,5-anhydro-D-fructose reductase (1,5-anhydro-D-mannitol-forming)
MPGFGLAKNCRVSALSRRNAVQARESARQYGIPHAFDSVESLCGSPEVDAVFVATPNASHLQDVLTAVQYHKPVLCEKPMAMNAEECKQMVETARQAGVLLGVAQVFRFHESTAWFQHQVNAGGIGHPIFARAEFCFSVGPQHPRTWIQDSRISGGGPIADVGVHCIDTLRFILRDEVTRVSTLTTSDVESGGVESSATLWLEFTGGTAATVFTSFRADYRTPIEVVGDAGALRADDALSVDKPVHLEFRRGGAVVESADVSNHMAYAQQVDAFAAAVEGRAPFPVPGEEGWQNQEILDAAYRSARSARAELVRRVLIGG